MRLVGFASFAQFASQEFSRRFGFGAHWRAQDFLDANCANSSECDRGGLWILFMGPITRKRNFGGKDAALFPPIIPVRDPAGLTPECPRLDSPPSRNSRPRS